eukprot:s1227_g6.t1
MLFRLTQRSQSIRKSLHIMTARRSSHLLLCSRLPTDLQPRWESFHSRSCAILPLQDIVWDDKSPYQLDFFPVKLHCCYGCYMLLPLLPTENPVWNGSKNDWTRSKATSEW